MAKLEVDGMFSPVSWTTSIEPVSIEFHGQDCLLSLSCDEVTISVYLDDVVRVIRKEL